MNDAPIGIVGGCKLIGGPDDNILDNGGAATMSSDRGDISYVVDDTAVEAHDGGRIVIVLVRATMSGCISCCTYAVP